ncbi:glycosyltransferase family 4 protein [Luteolibacter luteus]|uniref:Glycosyltransferase family 4 protein n=1 Tax=Luteolibacter luteus TaxID=2728835 RepID=A0A858RLC1_9BACT|nr:glycosyltransferase family 4 protein [Luteolibacter luteus]QJE96980.1 glycosyltransferase family 4 protein [Luteolibacter luteus]
MASQKKIIVHVGGYDPDALDGVSATLAGQCDALHRMGVAVEIWGFDPRVMDVTEGRTGSGIPLFRLPRCKHPLVAAFMMPPVTRRWIASRAGDIHRLHLHSVFIPSNNLIADLGLPYVVTPNGGWGERVLSGRNRLLKRLWVMLREKKLWSRAQAIQAVSEAEEKELSHLPAMGKVTYISNGVKIPPLDQIKGGRSVWLFLGRLAIEHKGLDRLITSYARCRQRAGSLPGLVLVGPDFRDGKAELERLIAEHSLQEHVEIRGPVVGGDKDRLFGEASLFLHTSRWEGMPLSILEAMSRSLPCLLTEGTNMVPLIRKFECGFPAGNSEDEIVEAMLLAKDGDLSALGQRARQCIEDNFSWDSVAKKLTTLYGLEA